MDNKITKAAAGGVSPDACRATAEELELFRGEGREVRGERLPLLTICDRYAEPIEPLVPFTALAAIST